MYCTCSANFIAFYNLWLSVCNKNKVLHMKLNTVQIGKINFRYKLNPIKDCYQVLHSNANKTWFVKRLSRNYILQPWASFLKEAPKSYFTAFTSSQKAYVCTKKNWKWLSRVLCVLKQFSQPIPRVFSSHRNDEEF